MSDSRPSGKHWQQAASATRRWTIFVLDGLLVISGIVYAMRWTYVRPVYDAQQNGLDPYQAARAGAAYLAGDFMLVAGIFGSLVFAIGVIIAFFAARAATGSSGGEASDHAGRASARRDDWLTG